MTVPREAWAWSGGRCAPAKAGTASSGVAGVKESPQTFLSDEDHLCLRRFTIVFRSIRLRRLGIACLLCALALVGPSARAEAPPPPLPLQLVELGRQALAAGAEDNAERFF